GALITPDKKREASAKKIRRKSEEIMRSADVTEELDGINMLMTDWVESPARARVADITLREVDVPPSETWLQPLEQEPLGPLGLGPPFYMLEDMQILQPAPEEAAEKRPDAEQQQEADADRRTQEKRGYVHTRQETGDKEAT
ncbi:hypothetical protein SK128_007800, partial [Halocaridina rubra]